MKYNEHPTFETLEHLFQAALRTSPFAASAVLATPADAPGIAFDLWPFLRAYILCSLNGKPAVWAPLLRLFVTAGDQVFTGAFKAGKDV